MLRLGITTRNATIGTGYRGKLVVPLFAALMAITIAAPANAAPPDVTAGPVQPACAVTYEITSQWPGGFQAAVRVINTSEQPILTWELGWSFRDGQTVRHLRRSVMVSQQSGSVTVRNATWNAPIAVGGSVQFGFLGTWSSANQVPSDFTVNGSPCGALPVPPPS